MHYIRPTHSFRSFLSNSSMKPILIFELDGTIYPLSQPWAQSPLGKAIRENSIAFLSNQLKIPQKKANEAYETVNQKYQGEISIGIEKKYGISRHAFFEKVWNIEPKQFLPPNANLQNLFKAIPNKKIILTAAPLIWAERVLAFYQLQDAFSSVYTGEPDIRKPNAQAFGQIISNENVSAKALISIGDQIETDIIPAKKLGMKTVLVGKPNPMADYCISRIEEIEKVVQIL